MKSKEEIFDQINSDIIAKLAAGTLPWRKGWKVRLPANYISRKVYQGINFLILFVRITVSPII
ncbi:MAG: hypothetical protein SCALA702_06330 [Melioribacteraceae bacterium]|nr:MAG: hypothetical protein SCALA702_06330 [Melioribacteraceae bacterium]